MRLIDGLTNVFNQLVNRRSAMAQNKITRSEISQDDLRHIFLTGIGSKIVRLKAGYSLDDSLKFDNDDHEEEYNKLLAKHVKKAARFMIGFGRGCVVLHRKGDNLSQPLTAKKDLILQVFSGDMVTVGDISRDLSSSRYMKPLAYNIRGHVIHHSRVIDFTYVEPSEFDLPMYRYGGVSEFELIYPQLINDAVVERASASMLDRSSNWVYKIHGLKDAMASKNDTAIIQYFSRIEDMRGIYGATLIDSEDAVEVHSQALTNLAETDQITLRRLSMVTGIPLAVLVGENVKGLNSTGENEQKMFQDMIETLQSDYLIEPIQALCKLFEIEVEFRENQGGTPESRMDFETKAIANAKALWEMGEDHAAYLEQYDIKKADDFEELWAEKTEEDKQKIVDEAKFEENKHSRDNDGKFSSGGSSATTTKNISSVSTRKKPASKQEKREMVAAIPSPPPDDAVNYIKSSVDKADKKGYYVTEHRDKNGKINAAGAWQKAKGEDAVFLETLGSMGNGGGTKILNEIIKESEKLGFGGAVTLFPARDPKAVKFYMNFETSDGRFFDAHPSGNGQWHLPAKK